jgi:general secretion pathway protein K
MRPILSNDRGSATLLMMLIGAVIITIGIGFNWLVKEHIRASEGLRDKTEAILKARSAFDLLIYLLLNGEMTRNEIIVSGGMEDVTALKTVPLDGREIALADDIHVRFWDTNGRISMFNADDNVLERLIRNSGRSDNPSVPVASLRDWIDKDEFSRVGGAEKAYYEDEGLPCVPRNYPLQYGDELGFIKGFTPELLNAILPSITMLPSAGFNPNTANDEVLKAYLNIDDGTVHTLRDYLSKKTIMSDMELHALVLRRIDNEVGTYYRPSFNMDVVLSVGEQRKLYTIKAGLNVGQKASSPYSVYYWMEE